MPQIQIETDKDRIVSTSAPSGLKVNMSNLEITEDAPKNVEIPESKRAVDSDSSGDEADKGNFTFLANKKKFNPNALNKLNDNASIKEPEKEEVKSEIINNFNINRPARDSDSEKSNFTHFSKRSFGKDNPFGKRDEGNVDSEYKPRYGNVGSQFDNLFKGKAAIPEPTIQPPPINLDQSAFSRRKMLYETMSEEEKMRRKSELLDQYEKKNRDGKFSPKRLTMSHDLMEIEDELERVKAKRRSETYGGVWKNGLLCFVNLMAAANDDWMADPYDLELGKWAEEVSFDIKKAGTYDDVIDELVFKYHRGDLPIAPEYKLMFMLAGSCAYSVFNRKREKNKMKKRLEKERAEDERVERKIQEYLAKVNMSQPSQQQNQQSYKSRGGKNMYSDDDMMNDMPQPQRMRQNAPNTRRFQSVPTQEDISQGMFGASFPYPPQRRSPVLNEERKMSGPSMSDKEILKMMEDQFMDSGVSSEEDDVKSQVSKASSKSNRSTRSKTSRKSGENEPKMDETSVNSVEKPIVVKRGPGRPRKTDKIQEKSSSQNDEGKVISMPPKKRGPGRPPKQKPVKEDTTDNVIELQL